MCLLFSVGYKIKKENKPSCNKVGKAESDDYISILF